MKNNVLSAFVVFFAVLATLLIIDDMTQGIKPSLESDTNVNSEINIENSESLATLDVETED